MDSHLTALWDYGHIESWSQRTPTILLEEAGFRGYDAGALDEFPSQEEIDRGSEKTLET
jgi:hypothetical protein